MTNQPTLRLHGNPVSSNARRAMLTLAHLGVPYELVSVNLRDPSARAGLRAINPNAKIPVLQHGDFWLWESHAIMQYVAELVPGQELYPYAPRARADINRWLFWHNAHLAPPLGTLGFERRWKVFVTGDGPDPAKVAAAEQLVVPMIAILDAHLAQHTWLANDELSLADLSIAATTTSMPFYGVSLAPYPHLQAHFGRVRALPAWAATEPPPLPLPSPAPEASPRGDRANVS